MLFALGDPASFVGLLLGFLAALFARAWAVRAARSALRLPRAPRPTLRSVVDPFGAVAAAVAGTGWGRHADLDLRATRGRRVAVVAAGLCAPLLLGLLVLVGLRLAYGGGAGPVGATLLHGFRTGLGPAADAGAGLAVALLCFSLLNLLPLPPLDGFSLLWVAMRRPGAHAARIRHTLVEQNVGPLILMILSFFPIGGPYLLLPAELLASLLLLALW
ncbi:hypothetical protein GCM10010124_32100 [Pilimelia terevasa]|uniref:Peptidase M50 n=1 Tax=Pilimelia terevasa TaxID=53372 RepID=A0A8J3FL27_9ACTN|nr:hypothetical protein [Pilimelia terevasa]GGK37034.1 hypothetical protein GCM10010124_32100 [Pilimelia terevasa]